MRCGLSVAVEKDVSQTKDRSPIDRLQPSSLVPHYKFVSKGSHITDAAPDHVTMVRQPPPPPPPHGRPPPLLGLAQSLIPAKTR